MRWFYDVKKRKTIIGVFIFVLFVCTTSLYVKLNIISNAKESSTSDATQTASVPELTMTPQAPEVTETPTVTPLATPTIILTLTPTITATPTTIPTNTPTPVATLTYKPTPTPSIKRPTPTPSLKLTPKITLINKTSTPRKTSTPKPLSTPSKVVSNKIVLRYKNGNTSANSDSIYPMFKIVNSGKQSIKLSNVKIRYYYTKEENKTETFWCDSFSKGATNVYGNFVSLSNKKSTADRYLEIGFSEAAGELKAGESAEVSVGFAKNDWSEYNQKMTIHILLQQHILSGTK